MGNLIQAVSQEICSRWFSGLSGSEDVASYIEGKFEIVLNKIAELYGLGDSQSDELLRKAFVVPDVAKSTNEAASHIADLLINWLPEDIRSIGILTAVSSSPTLQNIGASASLGATGTGQPPPDKTTLDEILNSLFQNNPGLEDAERQLKSLILQSSQAATAVRWTPDGVRKAIERLMRRFVILGTPNIDKAAKQIMAEWSTTLPMRFELAGAVQATGILYDLATEGKGIPIVPSSGQIGNQVHAKLQEKYRKAYEPNLICQEQTVYRPGQAPQSLGDAAAADLKSDASLTALYLARQSLLMRLVGAITRDDYLKGDNLDFDRKSTWEIKPVGMAAQGVLQEFFYRSTYNFYVAVGLDFFRFLKIKYPELHPGKDWDYAGKNLLIPFSVTVPQGSYTVWPFTWDEYLPGLIMYVVIQLPIGAVLVLSREILKLLDELMKKLEKLKEKLQELGDAVVEFFKVIISNLLKVALAAAIAAVIVMLLPEEVLATAVVVIIVGGVIVYRWITQKTPQRGEQGPIAMGGETARSKGTPDRITLNLGIVKLVDVPVKLLTEIHLRPSLSGPRGNVLPLPSDVLNQALSAAFPANVV